MEKPLFTTSQTQHLRGAMIADPEGSALVSYHHLTDKSLYQLEHTINDALDGFRCAELTFAAAECSK